MKYKEIDRDLLIRKRRIAFELGESTLPKYAKKFIERVLDSEELTPTFSETEIRADERTKVLDEAIENIIPTLYESNVDEETINTCKRLFEQMKGVRNE